MVTLLRLKSVSKKFGPKLAVDNLSLDIKPGEIYGYLGPNGAGKTTTIRLIMDFIRPNKGSISLFGKKLEHGKKHDFDRVGYLSADSCLYANWTAQQHLNFTNQMFDSSDALDLANQFQLDLNTKVSRLSSGNKQKLALILALMHKPKLLVLDEPTRGLDPILQHQIYDILVKFKSSGGAVFMSSHNLAEVQHICDRVGIIRNGRLVASETIQSLRKMHIHEINVVFDKPYDPAVFSLENVEIKKATKLELIAHITGDLNPILGKISQLKVRDIEIAHASLEDMFMRYYQ